MSAQPSASAIVIGAGIVGSACAMYLARAGVAVTVLEAAFPACGATAAGMGHLVIMDDSETQFSLTAYSLSLWKELFDELPVSCELQRCGTLWIAEDAEELSAVRQKHAFYSARGVVAEILDERAVAEREPSLRPLAGALHVPGDAVVYPPNAAASFLQSACRLGATVSRGWQVQRLEDRTVHCNNGVLHADFIINAAGNQSGVLSPEIRIVPRRGHLVITDRYPGTVAHQIVELGYLKSAHQMTEESVAFNVQPRSTGQLLIGSSRELGTLDAGVNSRILGSMLARAAHFMPNLPRLAATRCWTGFRPATADKLPIIGRSSAIESVWIAAGHEGLGITTSLATGRILSDMITGATPAIDPYPFRADRTAASAWA